MGKDNTKKKRKVKGSAGQLEIVHPNACGIDIGSRTHYVAVRPDRDEESVRSFGCLTPDLHEMGRWLKECQVDTVAVESTGVYWVPVAQVLERYGIEVNVVDGSHVKNFSGRKTDVQDCEWIRQLHRFGLLRGGFRPKEQIRVLRSYWRQRAELVKCCSRSILHMQKALEQMNLQLHKVISDISGVTGLRIIRAIVAGEHDPVKLAQMKHRLVKSGTETIAKALTGEYRSEHLFTLKQALETYDFYQRQIEECDKKTQQYLSTLESKADPEELKLKPRKKNKHRRRKNEPYFDLRAETYRITGVDLTLINGIDAKTAYTIISEIGIDVSAFPSERRFASWCALCPNNRITGGKVRSTRTRRVQNRVAHALRLAAQSLHSSNTALGAYYRRMRGRLGPSKAITATAHKLAVLVYRMLKHGEDYVDKGAQYYEERYKERALKNLRRRATVLGFSLVPLPETQPVSQNTNVHKPPLTGLVS